MSSNTVYELDYVKVVILLSSRLFLFISLIYSTRYCICLVSAFVCLSSSLSYACGLPSHSFFILWMLSNNLYAYNSLLALNVPCTYFLLGQ